jgi:hypothetical protein
MERRKEARYKIDAAVELKFGTTTVNAKAIEISKHGIRIECAQLIDPGTRVQAVIFLKEPQKVLGEVNWAIAEPGPTGILYTMGLFCESGRLVSDVDHLDVDHLKEEEKE